MIATLGRFSLNDSFYHMIHMLSLYFADLAHFPPKGIWGGQLSPCVTQGLLSQMWSIRAHTSLGESVKKAVFVWLG